MIWFIFGKSYKLLLDRVKHRSHEGLQTDLAVNNEAQRETLYDGNISKRYYVASEKSDSEFEKHMHSARRRDAVPKCSIIVTALKRMVSIYLRISWIIIANFTNCVFCN